jgi:hypothetical protein
LRSLTFIRLLYRQFGRRQLLLWRSYSAAAGDTQGRNNKRNTEPKRTRIFFMHSELRSKQKDNQLKLQSQCHRIGSERSMDGVGFS